MRDLAQVLRDQVEADHQRLRVVPGVGIGEAAVPRPHVDDQPLVPGEQLPERGLAELQQRPAPDDLHRRGPGRYPAPGPDFSRSTRS